MIQKKDMTARPANRTAIVMGAGGDIASSLTSVPQGRVAVKTVADLTREAQRKAWQAGCLAEVCAAASDIAGRW